MRYVLKIDIDFIPPKSWQREWESTRELILNSLGFKLLALIKKKSSSGKGLHYYFHIEGRKISESYLNKLQFLLGDDIVRVAINQARIKMKVKHWNKLFDHVIKVKPVSEQCSRCKIRRVVLDLIKEDDEMVYNPIAKGFR